MKVGDKIVCIGDSAYHEKNNIREIFSIYYINDDIKRIRVSTDNPWFSKTYFIEDFNENFITLKELRKRKLLKLKNNVSI